MNLLPQHIGSTTGYFNSVQTEMKSEKVNGAQRSTNIGEHIIPATLGVMNKTMIRNFLTKAENGTISIHQLTSFQMFTGATKGAHSLTVFVQSSMNESYRADDYNEERVTYYNGNIGALQNLMTTFANGKLEYNAIRADTNITTAYIPVALSKWDNVENNKLVFATFAQIQQIMAQDNLSETDTETVEMLWNGYCKQVQKELNDGLIIKSAVLIAKDNTIIPHKFPFINTPGINPNWSGAKLYGSAEHKRSYMPALTTISGIVVKTSKDEIPEELKSTIKQNYLFGLRNSSTFNKKKSVKVVESSVVDFDPASDLIEDEAVSNVKVNAVLDEKKEQVLTDLVLLSDINGRDTAVMLSIKDIKKDSNTYIKRTGSYQAIQNGSSLSLIGCQIIPRSLNGKQGNGVIGIDSTDGVLVGTLAVTFEIIKPVYKTMGTTGMGNGVSVSSDDGMTLDTLVDTYSSDGVEVLDVVTPVSVNSGISVSSMSELVNNGDTF